MTKMMNDMTVMGRVMPETKTNQSNERTYVNGFLLNERSYDTGRGEVNKVPFTLSGEAADRFLKEAEPGAVIVVNGYFQSSEFKRDDGSQAISYRLRGYDFYRVYQPGEVGKPLQQAIQPEFEQHPDAPKQEPAPEQQQAPQPPVPPVQQAPKPQSKQPAQSPYQGW
ncbi:single-stranded DNA-binding protein [Lacticaseibacillus suilingensis]|uniref:Single-stranded DNA-binding protein n=1 Tax=Lacticaseibacillus suilingensis TaxID=2799577 RepID=A0ABW4BIA7_9LACO|nr:single-stranded DNA-binding protein [Lacticaseibacillus suilingensis]